MVYVPHVHLYSDNLTPSSIDKKAKANGSEYWAPQFLYPNGWTMTSNKRALLIKGNRKSRFPMVVFWERNPNRFFFYLALVVLLAWALIYIRV